MIDENKGILMCKHKRIRKEYGTVIYNPTTIVLPNPKIHYDEMFQLMKKEKKITKKEKKVTKKIDIRKMKKEDHIKDLIDQSIISGSPNKEEPDKEEPDKDESDKEEEEEESKKVEESKKEEEESKKEEESKEESKEELEKKEPKGDLTKKRIMITNLNVEKDKEMFQL